MAELRDLASRTSDLTPEAQSALANELSARDTTRQDADDPAPPIVMPSSFTWFKGWLTIFEAWMAFFMIGLAFGYLLEDGPLSWTTLKLLVILAIPGTGLVLIAKRSPAARPFWLVSLGVWLAVGLVFPAVTGTLSLRSLLKLAAPAAWFLYWLKSQRIAREFRRQDSVDSAA